MNGHCVVGGANSYHTPIHAVFLLHHVDHDTIGTTKTLIHGPYHQTGVHEFPNAHAIVCDGHIHSRERSHYLEAIEGCVCDGWHHITAYRHHVHIHMMPDNARANTSDLEEGNYVGSSDIAPSSVQGGSSSRKAETMAVTAFNISGFCCRNICR